VESSDWDTLTRQAALREGHAAWYDSIAKDCDFESCRAIAWDAAMKAAEDFATKQPKRTRYETEKL
jgi:hypothetical protein